MVKIIDKKTGEPDGEEIFRYEPRYYTYGRKTSNPYRLRVTFDNVDPETGEILPSMTKQSEMEACDIHNILKQYSPAGLQQLIAESQAKGAYTDLPDDVDYQAALNTVLEGERAFATLPAHVRDRFHNNPAEFLEFMADGSNQDEAIKLGLATDSRQPDPAPMKVEVVNPPTEPAKPS